MPASEDAPSRPRVADLIPRLQLRGAEVFAQHLEWALRDRYTQRLFACYGGAPKTLAPLDPPAETSDGVAGDLLSRPRAAWSLRRRVARYGPDLVVAHGGEPLRVAVAAGLHRRAPLVYVRVSSVPPSLRTRGRMMSLREAYGRASAVVAVSESLREELIRVFGLDPGLVRVIRNGRARPAGLAPERRSSLRAEARVAGTGVLAIWTGRMVPEKDPMAALAVAGALDGEAPDVRLVMVGDGPLMDAVRARAAKLGNVTLTGTRADTADLTAASDLLLSTSVTEGAPGAFADALLAGVPVVTFDQGGVRDLIEDGGNGVLVQAGDESGLVRAVAALASDEAYRRRLAAGAVASGSRFDIVGVARDYDALYRELLSGPP